MRLMETNEPMDHRGVQLTTERLDLDPLRLEDADEMVDMLGDERLYAFIGGRPPTLDHLRSRYRRLAVGSSADRTEDGATESCVAGVTGAPSARSKPPSSPGGIERTSPG